MKDKKKSLLALYSKYPILNTGYIDFPNTVNNAMYADIKIQKDTVRIYNLHLQSFSIKLNTTKEDNHKFTEYFKKINSSLSKQIEQAKMVKQEATNYGKNLIICGDFNSTQFSLPYRILHKGLNDSFMWPYFFLYQSGIPLVLRKCLTVAESFAWSRYLFSASVL